MSERTTAAERQQRIYDELAANPHRLYSIDELSAAVDRLPGTKFSLDLLKVRARVLGDGGWITDAVWDAHRKAYVLAYLPEATPDESLATQPLNLVMRRHASLTDRAAKKAAFAADNAEDRATQFLAAKYQEFAEHQAAQMRLMQEMAMLAAKRVA
jgi:hypothetical protein